MSNVQREIAILIEKIEALREGINHYRRRGNEFTAQVREYELSDLVRTLNSYYTRCDECGTEHVAHQECAECAGLLDGNI